MKRPNPYFFFVLIVFTCLSCADTDKGKDSAAAIPVYDDVPYLQDYAIKFGLENESTSLSKVYMDRNGVIQVVSSEGILRTHDGRFLYPGVLVQDKTYRPLTDKNVKGMCVYQNQFVYLDDKAIFSNAWAGTLYLKHDMPKAFMVAAGDGFDFMISDGASLEFLSKSKVTWSGELMDDTIKDVLYDKTDKKFWVLGEKSIASFD